MAVIISLGSTLPLAGAPMNVAQALRFVGYVTVRSERCTTGKCKTNSPDVARASRPLWSCEEIGFTAVAAAPLDVWKAWGFPASGPV